MTSGLRGADPGSGGSPEFGLLASCVRAVGTWPDGIAPEGIAAMDWGRLRFLAARLRVGPLLWGALRTAPEGAVPEGVLDAARAAFEAGAARSLQLTAELLRVSRALDEAGVPSIPYKGPTLAWRLYGNVTMRVFKDLDLVVRPGQLDQARAALLGLGYRDLHPTTRAAQRVLKRAAHELTMVDGDRVVELHWGVAPRQFAFALDVRGLFARAQRVTLQGREFMVPAPEDELLMLCVHGARDRWQWLDNVASVQGLVVLNPNLDWEAAEARAERLGGRRMLFLGLALAADLLDTPLPPAVADRMRRDPRLTALRAARGAAIIGAGPADLSPEGLRQLSFHLGVRERARDRVEYCLRSALTPNIADCEVVGLPPRLAFLYYPLHVGRLVGRYTPGIRRWAG